MTHILFVLYTALSAIAVLGSEEGSAALVGLLTGVAILLSVFRYFPLLRRGGYYLWRFMALLLALPVLIPYLLLPHRIAAIICWGLMALWLYGIPGGRLLLLRTAFLRRLRAVCRKRGYSLERAEGGWLVRTPHAVYDVRLVGAFYPVDVVELTAADRYTVRRVPRYVARDTSLLRDMLDTRGRDGGQFLRLLVVGKERTRTLAWSPLGAGEASAERVLVFLPELCEWRFHGGEQVATNGTILHGVTLYDASVFLQNRLS